MARRRLVLPWRSSCSCRERAGSWKVACVDRSAGVGEKVVVST